MMLLLVFFVFMCVFGKMGMASPFSPHVVERAPFFEGWFVRVVDPGKHKKYPHIQLAHGCAQRTKWLGLHHQVAPFGCVLVREAAATRGKRAHFVRLFGHASARGRHNGKLHVRTAEQGAVPEGDRFLESRRIVRIGVPRAGEPCAR